MGSGRSFSTVPVIPRHVVATGKSLVAVSKTGIERRFRLASERRECNYIQQKQQCRSGTNQDFCFHTYCFKRLRRPKTTAVQNTPYHPPHQGTRQGPHLQDPPQNKGHTCCREHNRAYTWYSSSSPYNTHNIQVCSCNRQKPGSNVPTPDQVKVPAKDSGQTMRTQLHSAEATVPLRHQSEFLFSYVLFLKG
ncbi:hypothetical protein SAMN06298214_0963 [Bacteroidales bacterium WCE2004]|nr:hypothetical protein SAMN06298214_0963 [Bacteroidales bacterium WCE2004]